MEEYDVIGPFLGSIVFVLRSSVGDFDFEASTHLEPAENVIFFIVFVLIFMMNCILLLNFIISEIGSIYEQIRRDLEGLKMKDRMDLITEAEDMILWFMNEKKMPKYIIIR